MLNPFWILSYLHFYATPTLGFFLQIRVFKGVRSIYPLHVPHWDFNKGCNFAQIINDCLLIHLSRIFDPWQFTTYGSSWMQTFFFHLAKWICVTNLTFFKQKCDCTIHVHRNAKSNIWLNYTSNSLEASEFFGSI